MRKEVEMPRVEVRGASEVASIVICSNSCRRCGCGGVVKFRGFGQCRYPGTGLSASRELCCWSDSMLHAS